MICDACGVEAPRVALHIGQWLWLCPACTPPIVCRCGIIARCVGIERFAIGTADTDAYALDQAARFLCAMGHVTAGDVHPGPGASAAKKTNDAT